MILVEAVPVMRTIFLARLAAILLFLASMSGKELGVVVP